MTVDVDERKAAATRALTLRAGLCGDFRSIRFAEEDLAVIRKYSV